jgi:hypothetical protein
VGQGSIQQENQWKKKKKKKKKCQFFFFDQTTLLSRGKGGNKRVAVANTHTSRVNGFDINLSFGFVFVVLLSQRLKYLLSLWLKEGDLAFERRTPPLSLLSGALFPWSTFCDALATFCSFCTDSLHEFPFRPCFSTR